MNKNKKNFIKLEPLKKLSKINKKIMKKIINYTL